MAHQNATTAAFTFQHIPQELQNINHWILWKKVWKPEKQKYDKIPTRVDGYGASITNPAHFSTFTEAVFAYQMGVGDGIGFCFTGDEGLVFVDIDNAIENGNWVNGSQQVVQSFPTWGELSQSGKGVHFIAQGTLDRAHVNNKHGLEIYKANRFMAVTGWQLPGYPDTVNNCQQSIDWLAQHIESLKGGSGDLRREITEMPPLGGPVDIRSLKISSPISDFLTKGVADKWDGDRSRAMLAASMSLYSLGLSDGEVLSTMWHHCGHIAREHRPFGDATEWLWQYCVSIGASARKPEASEIFDAQQPSTGALVQAVPASVTHSAPVNLLDKAMADIHDLELGSVTDTETILKARRVLAESLSLDAGSRIAVRDGVRRAMAWTKTEVNEVLKEVEKDARKQRLSQSSSMDSVLQEYLYVANVHAFYHKGTGQLLKPEAFVALHNHLSQDVRDVVLSGDGCAKVTGIDFDPGQPEFFMRNGGYYYNSWRGLASVGTHGDITPWWNHLCALVPEEEEREHLLNFMAFTLQRPQEKINHCIVFGGDPGIGKDTLFWPLTQGLGRHAKPVGASVLLRDFDDFYAEAKLVVFQEVDMGNRREASIVANRLKPIIASPPDTLYINPKGHAGFDIKNVVHSVLFTNEHHPVLISDRDRRYFVLTSDICVTDAAGRQTPEWRDYFAGLWYWMQDCGGWQHVVYYLLGRNIKKFNPKAAPPMTEGKALIIEEGRSSNETMIMDLITDRIGPFQFDIVTPKEISMFLATEGLGHSALYGVRDPLSVVQVGKIMRNIGAKPRKVYSADKHGQERVWIIRDHAKWGSAGAQEVCNYVEFKNQFLRLPDRD